MTVTAVSSIQSPFPRKLRAAGCTHYDCKQRKMRSEKAAA